MSELLHGVTFLSPPVRSTATFLQPDGVRTAACTLLGFRFGCREMVLAVATHRDDFEIRCVVALPDEEFHPDGFDVPYPDGSVMQVRFHDGVTFATGSAERLPPTQTA